MIKTTLGLCAFLITLIAPPTVSADSLPNRQRRLALDYIAQTPTGTEILNIIGSNWNPYNSTSFLDLGPSQISDFNKGTHELLIHANYLSSSPLYMSWIFVHGLAEVAIAKVTSDQRLPQFIENEQIAFIWAMHHWSEVDWSQHGPASEHDYANHSQKQMSDFAKAMLTGTTEWNQLWCKSDLTEFLLSVESRSNELGHRATSVHKYLRRSNLTQKQRTAAEKIRDLLHSSLTRAQNSARPCDI